MGNRRPSSPAPSGEPRRSLTVDDVLPPGIGRVIRQTFALREIAEEEVDGAMVRDDVLAHLAPGPFLDLVPDLYRDHVREVCRRKGTNVTLDVTTEAEVLVGLMHASYAAPLREDGALLYDRIFHRIFGKRFGDEPREQWKGQAAELLEEARRKVRTGRPRVRVEPRRRGTRP
jgi:hypothetical protein